jgi:serine/alanine adding enzyme
MNGNHPSQERDAAGSVRVVEAADPGDWNGYLARREHGCLYHRLEWDRVFAVYRLPTIRLTALRGERVVGILPLVWQQSRLFGNRLVSLPWFDSAGVLADDGPAREALVSAAAGVAHRCGRAKLVLRQREPVESWSSVRTDKVLMRLTLEADPAALWKRLSAKVRNQVRKAQKAALRVETGGAETVADFCRVYSANMRDLGSPSHSQRFFQAVMESFGDEAQIHLVKLGRQVIGGGLTLRNGQAMEIPWASSLRGYNAYCVNHLLYWHLLDQACQGGFRWFHFGRSTKDSGTFHFKKQWGAEPVQLYWYCLTEGGGPRETSPPEDSFGLAIRVWQRLPLWLTRIAGPRIVRKVP